MPLILYVDDDVVLQLDAQAMLEAAGHEVIVASSGREACALMCAQGERLDALLTDINLGSGIDGWKVAEAGRDIRLSLPVLYLSGSDRGAFAAHGVADSAWISKPLEWGRVVEQVEAMLAADRMAGRLDDTAAQVAVT